LKIKAKKDNLELKKKSRKRKKEEKSGSQIELFEGGDKTATQPHHRNPQLMVHENWGPREAKKRGGQNKWQAKKETRNAAKRRESKG